MVDFSFIYLFFLFFNKTIVKSTRAICYLPKNFTSKANFTHKVSLNISDFSWRNSLAWLESVDVKWFWIIKYSKVYKLTNLWHKCLINQSISQWDWKIGNKENFLECAYVYQGQVTPYVSRGVEALMALKVIQAKKRVSQQFSHWQKYFFYFFFYIFWFFF